MQSTPVIDLGSDVPQIAGKNLAKIRLMLRALRHRNYRLFFGGQLVSLVGTWMQMVAQSWLVYRLTGSSLLLGSVGFASQIPVLLLAFIGGTVADKYDRHKVVIATQTVAMIQALILALLTLSGTVRIWHVFVLAAMLGVVNAFDMPARQAFVVELVRKEDLINAIALNSTLFNGARVLGPAVAGVLIAGIGEGWCFFANSLSFLAVIGSLLLMRLDHRAPVSGGSSGISEVLEGFRFVRRTGSVRNVLMLLGLVSLVGMPYSVLMPIFADSILHGGPRGLGILMGSTGLGAVAGAIALAARSNSRGLRKLIALASAGFGASLILFSASRSFWLSALFLVPVGFSFMLQMACTNTMIQLMVPDKLRGRVMAVHTTIFMGMAPFGSFLAGIIAENVGAPLAVALGGICCLAGSALFSVRGSSASPPK